MNGEVNRMRGQLGALTSGTSIPGGDCGTETNAIQPEQKCRVVTIHKVENGFLIQVGCKTFVSKDWDEVSRELKKYYDNPADTEAEYCKRG